MKLQILIRKDKLKEDELALKERRYPIQVKQKGKVGRPDKDSLEAMLMREELRERFLRMIRLQQRRDDNFSNAPAKSSVPSLRDILDEEIGRKLA